MLRDMMAAEAQNRLHHGWIFTGPKGIGKARFALEFAAQLLARQPDLLSSPSDDLSANNLSSGEVNLVYQHTHPDFLYIQPEQSDTNKSGQIRVEQIRSINQFMATSSARGGWRVVIIDTMDEVNQNGANALLKILEEPPTKAVLLLLASTKGQLLPTISSRCRLQPVKALSEADCMLVLRQIYPDAEEAHLRALSCLASGAPGQAVSLSDAGGVEAYEQSCAAFGAGNLSNLMALAALWGEGGVKAAPKRLAGGYLLGRLFAAAALAAARGGSAPEGLLAYEQQAIKSLCLRFTAHDLADMHTEVTEIFEDAKQFYLDAAVLFQPFLLKIHGKS